MNVNPMDVDEKLVRWREGAFCGAVEECFAFGAPLRNFCKLCVCLHMGICFPSRFLSSRIARSSILCAGQCRLWAAITLASPAVMVETSDPHIRVSQNGEGQVLGVNEFLHDCEQWTSLGKFVTALAATDLAFKSQVLQNLSLFLSSSTETFTLPSPASSQEISVSAVVGSKNVRIKYDDILDLHDSLFQGLAQHIPSFFSDCESFTGKYDTFPSTSMELKVTALTLRCCIRLLPLIELFDTGLRYTAGVAIDRLLQKLSSPTEPCLRPGVERTPEEAPSEVRPYRALTLCAILEVYIDELLSRPKTQFLFLQNHTLDTLDISEKEDRSTERITMEATLAHVLISTQLNSQLQGSGFSELSLQAALMLLDRAIYDNMPQFILSHVMNMVSQAFGGNMSIPNSTTDRGTSTKSHSLLQYDPKKWFSRYTSSGYPNSLEGHRFDAVQVSEALPLQVLFCLISSVLERAVSLYMRHSCAPHLADIVNSSTKNSQQAGVFVSSSLLTSCLWNYVNFRGVMNQKCEAALEAILNDSSLRKGLGESFDQTCWNGHDYAPVRECWHRSDRGCKLGYPIANIERESGTFFSSRELCSGSFWDEENSSLVGDILHLVHSALDFITEKLQKLQQEVEEGRLSEMIIEDLDNGLLGIVGAFHECIPSIGEVTEFGSIGHVLFFFTDMLYYEAEKTIPESRLQEYLELLQSLVVALLMEDKWRSKVSELPQPVHLQSHANSCLEADAARQKEFKFGTLPALYAREVVGLLQGFLEEPDLLEILGEHAVQNIVQINSFLNDFCEFMDNVLLTNAWRESIPANGRRIVKRAARTVKREMDVNDRKPTQDSFLHDTGPWDEERSPEKEIGGEVHQSFSANFWVEGRQLRPSTIPILQKLSKHRAPPLKLCDQSPERNIPVELDAAKSRTLLKCKSKQISAQTTELSNEENQYVAEVILLEKTSSKENYDDLKDFIVCKKGRSYTSWLNRRTKFRMRKHTREIWKRAADKKKLLSLLNIV